MYYTSNVYVVLNITTDIGHFWLSPKKDKVVILINSHSDNSGGGDIAPKPSYNWCILLLYGYVY